MRIVLDNAPPFYTNLDNVAGRVVLFLQRTEQIAGIVVKLEGEARTIAYDDGTGGGGIEENHKILYQVEQVFPRPGAAPPTASFAMRAGPHEFPFRIKLPFNNVCWDIQTMAKMGGGFLGGGVRVMDGSKQMLLHHAKRTLPPSFVAWPKKAEVRYYIKVTVQRPGLLNPNWRHQIDFRFMPIEEPRPENSEAKAYAKRPFAFKPKAPAAISAGKSLFGKGKHEAPEDVTPPSVEMCAWFPHPTILTCNKPVPLRLVATKKAASSQPVFLTSIAIELTGKTEVRCYENVTPILNRFVILSNTRLRIPLTKSPSDPVGTEFQVPDDLWRTVPLPNTISPSFHTCNITRMYQLELKLGVSWETPTTKGMFSSKDSYPNVQTIVLPLLFNDVKIYSGIAPPPEVLRAMANRRQTPAPPRPAASIRPPTRPARQERPPQLPPRTNSGRIPVPQEQMSPVTGPNQVPVAVTDAPAPTAASYDPLYPPQVGTPGAEYDEAPPSYDEAMAEVATGPAERPEFSGETEGRGPGPGEVPSKGGA